MNPVLRCHPERSIPVRKAQPECEVEGPRICPHHQRLSIGILNTILNANYTISPSSSQRELPRARSNQNRLPGALETEVSALENRRAGQSPLFRISWIPFYVVILSAVFRFAKRTGMRSRRTPRPPAPRALSMGILNMIQNASHSISTQPQTTGAPSFPRPLRKRGKPESRPAHAIHLRNRMTPDALESDLSALENRSVG